MSRRKEREEACLELYKVFTGNNSVSELSLFSKDLVDGVKNNQKELIKIANKYLYNWTLDRFSLMDKAIILVALYELTYTDTPYKIVINEAINLTKKYSDVNVTKMTNALLDKYFQSELKEKIDG